MIPCLFGHLSLSVVHLVEVLEFKRYDNVQKKILFLQETYLFKSVVSTVLVDRTQSFGRNLHFHELTKFGNPNALFLKVGENGTIDSLSDVTTNTALFLGKTGAMDTTTFVRHGTSDDANTGHGNRSYLLIRDGNSSVFLPKVKNNRTKDVNFVGVRRLLRGED